MQACPRRRPFRLVLLPTVVLALGLAAPGFALDAEDEEEPGAFRAYLNERANNFKGGLNGFITWPADPVVRTMEAKELFESWWPPFNYMAAFMTGTCEGVYRLVMGTVDIAFTPFPYFPMLSPVQRYEVVPFDHEDE